MEKTNGPKTEAGKFFQQELYALVTQTNTMLLFHKYKRQHPDKIDIIMGSDIVMHDIPHFNEWRKQRDG